jgi:hypothetical protein
MGAGSKPNIKASADSFIVCRRQHWRESVIAPGEEAQVDYGSEPMVRDPQTGKYRRTRLFVLTLGFSRIAVRLLTFRSNVRIWAELH